MNDAQLDFSSTRRADKNARAAIQMAFAFADITPLVTNFVNVALRILEDGYPDE